ncbi:MAG: carbon storage regulator [Armatimonadota bacterium]|nr:carbon storage regulator [Armatimonadota bacterium]
MLVLTRKVGQSILIGETIEITLIEVRGEQARLGITAPRIVSVRRKELVARDGQVNEVSPESDDQPSASPDAEE